MGGVIPPYTLKEGEIMKQIKKIDNTGFITNSAQPILNSVRFFPKSDSDELTIYDSNIGPVYGEDIAHLDKAHPTIDFGVRGKRCTKGLYAFKPRGGYFYADWDN